MTWIPRRFQTTVVIVPCLVLGATGGQAATHRVPLTFPTIQAAINAAGTGDMVLISRGSYTGGLVIAGKAITLASEYLNTGDPDDVSLTIVTGGNPMIRIDATAADTTVQGISFQSAGYGLVTYASRTNILDNRFIGTRDAVSFESAGGVCRGNYFDGASDDGIDMDNPNFDTTIEDNTILNARDDGIEIRLQPYTGPMASIVLRSNHISGALEDGIQLIDYSGVSNRMIRIERNVIVNNAMVGLGCMAGGNTTENFAGAPMVEDVRVLNNTLSGNPYGITSSDNMLIMNNIIASSTQIGLKRALASSLARYNAFWNNGTNYTTSNVDTSSTMTGNPLLDASYNLQPGSACIDAGAASLLWNGQTVSSQPYNGPAPDLGARETAAGVGAPGRIGGLSVHLNPDRVNLDLSWGPACADATDYGVYAGMIGAWYSHHSVQCSTAGSTSATIAPGAGNRYLLIVPNNSNYEGSNGLDSSGLERPAVANGCRAVQSTQPCP